MTGGSGVAGEQHSGHSGGVQPGGGHGPAGGGGVAPGGQRAPYRDPLDPRGPMGMPKIVSGAAERLGLGQRGGGGVAAGIYVLSVLAIIIAFGIYFIVGGH